MVFSPSSPPAPALVASTGVNGFALQNGTPNILSWVAPNDGQAHRVTVVAELRVTSAETGGQVNLSGTLPDGTAFSFAVENGGQGGGQFRSQFTDMLVQAGSTTTLAQNSALTVGAAVLWAELWAL
jgi:hypothetical protein